MHKNMDYVKQHWKMLLNIVMVVALLILIIALRHELINTIKNLKKVDAWALLLMIPIEIVNYHSQARLYQRLFTIIGNQISYRSLYETSLELNFINSVLPSGGVSGISYFNLRMRSEDISAGKATLVQMIKLLLIFLSFEVLLIIGLLFMAVGGRVNDLTILIATSVSTLLVVGTLGFVLIIGSRTRINTTFAFITRLINRIIQFFHSKQPEAIKMDRVRRVVDELHDNYKLIQENHAKLKQPFFYALIANLTEVLAIYVVYIAFGHWVNFGAVIVAYAVANFAGFISVLPGGLGVYEALMTGVLALAGIPVSLSIPVVVMYRILNTILQVPPGYFFYHRTLKRTHHRDMSNA